ncbi:MAG: hypothetical protein HW405_520 [Candidatus Berkelbacteria bacterium]|nr:hypothetical protein [Candidatus Berkelbacteria bacterium]
MARRHLAIFLKGTAEKILSGKKRVEVRLSLSKILPYLSVCKNDEIYLKNSGGKIIGKVTVDNCLYYENLSQAMVADLKNNYFQSATVSNEFWDAKKKAKFASIIFLKNPHKFLTPVVYKKHDRRAWIIIEN